MSKVLLTLTKEHWKQIIIDIRRAVFDNDPRDATERVLPLEFEFPSPWSLDISKAPKDGTQIIVIVIDDEGYEQIQRVSWCGDHCPDCHWEGFDSEYPCSYEDHEISTWTLAPSIPERI